MKKEIFGEFRKGTICVMARIVDDMGTLIRFDSNAISGKEGNSFNNKKVKVSIEVVE